ncbi:MAG: hypothetical protein LBO77_04995 [Desulfovibrio sp.]|jgi:hypothetical protein|nr:hypothetical protein [Desulfovibrio sp.]
MPLEQFNFKKVGLLGKDLPANPCREMLAGELGPPLSNHLKAKLVWFAILYNKNTLQEAIP